LRQLPSTRPVRAALCCVLLVACAGDDGGDAVGPDAGSTVDASESPDGGDTIAPTILSTTPTTGATGQLADVVVSIVFSEPMNRASVEGTLATASLGVVQLGWNEAGDTITITPTAPLAYAEGIGNNPAAVTAASFTVILGSAARDLAGNELGTGTQISFTTLKRISSTYALDPVLTRSLTAAATPLGDASGPLPIGDRNTNDGVRALVTFDIGLVPLTTVEVTSAVFATRQLVGMKTGAPYGAGVADQGLGAAVMIDHVTFGALDNAAFNASQTAHAALGAFCVYGQVVVEKDVTAAVDDDRIHRNARNSRSQFLLRFPLETDQDGVGEGVYIDRSVSELQVTYLAP
jgi:hypothetical protein